jgi:Zn-dependent alcohol dehydrogenase
VPELVQLALDGALDVAPFVSRTLTLGEVNFGFELREAQAGIRSVIRFE